MTAMQSSRDVFNRVYVTADPLAVVYDTPSVSHTPFDMSEESVYQPRRGVSQQLTDVIPLNSLNRNKMLLRKSQHRSIYKRQNCMYGRFDVRM